MNDDDAGSSIIPSWARAKSATPPRRPPRPPNHQTPAGIGSLPKNVASASAEADLKRAVKQLMAAKAPAEKEEPAEKKPKKSQEEMIKALEEMEDTPVVQGTLGLEPIVSCSRCAKSIKSEKAAVILTPVISVEDSEGDIAVVRDVQCMCIDCWGIMDAVLEKKKPAPKPDQSEWDLF